MNPIILLPAMGKIVGQTRFFSLGEATSLGEGKLWIQTCQTPLKKWPCVISYPSGGVGKYGWSIWLRFHRNVPTCLNPLIVNQVVLIKKKRNSLPLKLKFLSTIHYEISKLIECFSYPIANKLINKNWNKTMAAKTTKTEEYTDCIAAEGWDPILMNILDITQNIYMMEKLQKLWET